MVFLDTNVVIYLMEQPPIWGAKATARITSVLNSGELLAVSDFGSHGMSSWAAQGYRQPSAE